MNYIHGGDVYRNKIEYDFSININPLGMPLASIRAAHEGIVLSGRYPDYMGDNLCTQITETDCVSKNNIILGNGAAELIYSLCNSIKPGRGFSIAPTFQEYESAIKASGGLMDYFDLDESDEYKVDDKFIEYLKKNLCGDDDNCGCSNSGSNIVFLCNPNNPTGKIIEPDILLEIAEICENTGTYLCVDESFLPFLSNESHYTMKDRLSQYRRLIILRAFTKIYGMPGLRLGYALSGNTILLDDMRSKIQPWNTSIPAQMAGTEALKDKEFLEKTRELIEMERTYLVQEMQQGLVKKIYKSYTNFILFRAECNLKELLLDKGILIRECENFRNLTDEHFRIGVRSHSENQELILRWNSL